MPPTFDPVVLQVGLTGGQHLTLECLVGPPVAGPVRTHTTRVAEVPFHDQSVAHAAVCRAGEGIDGAPAMALAHVAGGQLVSVVGTAIQAVGKAQGDAHEGEAHAALEKEGSCYVTQWFCEAKRKSLLFSNIIISSSKN